MRDFIYTLLKVQTAYRRVFQQKIRDKGIVLTFEMFQVLSCLFEKDKINQQEIANRIFRDKSSLSYILKNLEKKGLIERLEDENDKRNKLIYLTEEGVSIKKEVRSILKNIYGNTLEHINDKKKVTHCISYLKDIEYAFKQCSYEG